MQTLDEFNFVDVCIFYIWTFVNETSNIWIQMRQCTHISESQRLNPSGHQL